MSGRTLLGTLALVVLGLLAWELRLVLLVLFGAVVLAVALDVPITLLRRLLPLSRPAALLLELVVLAVVGWLLTALLLPEVLEQIQVLSILIPRLPSRLHDLSSTIPLLHTLELKLMGGGHLGSFAASRGATARLCRWCRQQHGAASVDRPAGSASGPGSPQPPAIAAGGHPPVLPGTHAGAALGVP